ncbi:hypothetical protein ACFLUX_01635 [Chloroflexota bacterium]
MSRCHNCGRETLRTEDWACQWCGYPLVSGSFGKIEKTYRQLKEERLHKPEEEPEPEREIEQIEVPESEEEPEKEEEPKKEEEPIQEPEPESEIEQEIKPEESVLDEAEAKTGTEPVSALEIEQETEPVPEPEAEPELKPAEMELTVSEIFTAYEIDDIAAGERFADKILRITGVVSLIDVKNISDTHYIRLTGSEGDLMQSVQCMFGKKYASLLCQLVKGQVVTVQGRYNGSIIAMRMVDCVLIL